MSCEDLVAKSDATRTATDGCLTSALTRNLVLQLTHAVTPGCLTCSLAHCLAPLPTHPAAARRLRSVTRSRARLALQLTPKH